MGVYLKIKIVIVGSGNRLIQFLKEGKELPSVSLIDNNEKIDNLVKNINDYYNSKNIFKKTNKVKCKRR